MNTINEHYELGLAERGIKGARKIQNMWKNEKIKSQNRVSKNQKNEKSKNVVFPLKSGVPPGASEIITKTNKILRLLSFFCGFCYHGSYFFFKKNMLAVKNARTNLYNSVHFYRFGILPVQMNIYHVHFFWVDILGVRCSCSFFWVWYFRCSLFMFIFLGPRF